MPTFTRNSTTNNNNSSADNAGTAVAKVRYVLGESTCVFEPAQHIAQYVDEAAVARLFVNENMSVEATQGRSLKVLLRTNNLVKFVGFITASDATISLGIEDAEQIVHDAVANGIIKDLTAEEIVGLF